MQLKAPPFDFACLVGGEQTNVERRIEVRYPYTGAVIGSVPALGEADVLRAIRLGATAGPSPSRYERSQILLTAAARIEAEREDVARLITWESGLCLHDTRHEVRRALDVLRFAAGEALRDDGQCFSFDVSPNGRNRRGYTVREPLRLVTAITPFNHPLNQVAHKVAPAIAAGTPVVLKPSEKTPLSAIYLASVLLEAGLPPNMLQVVTGYPRELARPLITHPDVELVTFTGGVAVGKHIAETLGYRRAVLELGGNDPLIVLDDADLDEAARLAVAGAFGNSGQRCTAVKRILVFESVADAFVARLVERTQALVVGDPFDDRTEMGTVISEEAAIRLEEAANATVADGAELLCGNTRRGALYWPTVLDRVPETAASVQEETFGPHAPVLRVRDLDEAIRVANGTAYGLSAGVCSNDLQRITRLVRELRVGTVNVREVPGYRSEASPFGGVKDSGIGVKEGVAEAIKAMTNVKLYTLPWGLTG